jgi:ABC-2 type transport system permease protein
MEAESINIFIDYLNPARLFGPIFDKELRVSCRKKRNYWLRSAYVVILAVFILYMWFSVIGVRNSGTSIYQVSRQSQIGKQAIIGIVWFQFVVAQILAIIMLSSSISDEVRTGTLNVLMTTPINSFQIVTGKLFSILLQVLILLTVSMPLLAIIRIFGGIPWQFVVSSFWVTLVAIIFAGSLSLLFSTIYRNAYHVIVLIVLIYIIFFGVMPLFLLRFLSKSGHDIFILFINPFLDLYAATQNMSVNALPSSIWQINCLFMLGMSAIFLCISIWKIRFAALGKVSAKSETRKVIKDKNEIEVEHYYEFPCRIKRVGDDPIAWKESYGGFFGKSKINKIVTILIYLFIIIGISFCLYPLYFAPILSLAIFCIYLIVVLRLTISTAGSISGEKEARTLPILLVTPLEDKDIILGKVKAAIRRNISIIILYLFMQYTLFFSYGSRGVIRSSQIIYQIPVCLFSIVSSVLFIVGCGAYFGVRMKNSTAAIVSTIGVFFCVSFTVGIFNPVRLISTIILVRIASPRTVSLFLGLTSSFVTLIILGAIGFFLLKKSICKLRSNIF